MPHRSSLPIKPIDARNFYAITVISNPIRYRVRYDLYRKLEKHCADSGITLITVEMAFGNRVYEITSADNQNHVQLRSSVELWHKENLLNVAIQNLPSSWQAVAWIDADISFQRPDWVQETLQQLQHYDFVQMFSSAIDIGPDTNPMGVNLGFAYCYHNQHLAEIPALLLGDKLNHERHVNGKKRHPHGHQGCPYYLPARGDKRIFWHPGYAWAARRESLHHTGGLLDTSILGAADHHMALAILGRAHEAMPEGVTEGYKKTVMDWQGRCDKYIRRNIGYVPGTILHGWHGKKADRKYWDRWQILTRNQYDPFTDLKRDWQGLYQLVDHGDERSLALRDQIRSYFRSRNEDSIDP